jgi:hypothetical protein
MQSPQPRRFNAIIRPAFCAIIIAITLTCEPWKATAEEPTRVTAKQLLAMPREFNGKRVSVVGYFLDSFEGGSCLFADAKASKNSKSRFESIWIDQSALFNPGISVSSSAPIPGISEACELTSHYVRIVGIFYNKTPTKSLRQSR